MQSVYQNRSGPLHEDLNPLCATVFVVRYDCRTGASASDNIAGQAGAAVPVASGQAVALNGSWKFHVGDDPQWAEPAFDDSQWEQFEMYR